MIEPVVAELQIPPGMLGPEPVTIDVRCFVVTGPSGIVLIDTGPPGTADAIGAAIVGLGASWADVTDIVLTHRHFDHVAGLADVAGRAQHATIRAGAWDVEAIETDVGGVVRALVEGDRIHDLDVVETPGHTAGHISLMSEGDSTLVIGDLVGSSDGDVILGPAAFTADPILARRSLERVPALGAARILFSHGAEVSEPNAAIGRLLG